MFANAHTVVAVATHDGKDAGVYGERGDTPCTFEHGEVAFTVHRDARSHWAARVAQIDDLHTVPIIGCHDRVGAVADVERGDTDRPTEREVDAVLGRSHRVHRAGGTLQPKGRRQGRFGAEWWR